MSRSLTRVFLAVFAAGGMLLFMSTGSWAQGPGGMPPDPARMASHMAKRLDMSGAQREQLQALVQVSRDSSAAAREEMRSLHQELSDMRGEFDIDRARAITQRMGELSGELMFEFSRLQAETYALLTDEQKVRMDALLAEHQKRHGGRRGEERPGGGQE